MSNAVRVWDLPTRLFHWLTVLLVAFSWWSAENREMAWHQLSGLAVFGLVIFRLAWGVMGGSTARFANFLSGPGAVMEYLRGSAARARQIGHNPLGALSVLALLGFLLFQTISGMFASDVDGLESGPLSFLISFEQSRTATEWHEISFNLLLAMIALHLVAIVYYRLARGRNLVRPMITGVDPQLDRSVSGLIPAGPAQFILAALIGAGAAWAASKGFFL
ncbi:MAG: cytochrome b/b6 domain-containing protein [Novosphingobium sp.]